jgi:spermidine synthase
MTLMPNETNTTKPAIDIAYGKVLTFGLGLGYFTFMASIKHDVESVTVVERSDDVIELFERFILPQFPDPSKIKIVRSDAFDFAENQMAKGAYDSVFVDIWHDPSDGCDLYLKMKEYETLLPKAKFVYWVEDTLKLYI